MRYKLLGGVAGKRRYSTLVLATLAFISWCLLYYVVTTYTASVLDCQKQLSSISRTALTFEKAIATVNRNVGDEIAVIAEIAKGNLSNDQHEELKEVQKALQLFVAPRFRHRPETAHLNCGRLFAGDAQYVKEVVRSRITMVPTLMLDMSCEAIRWRVLPRMRQAATNFGIAFARIVHTDYEFLEEQLQVNYSPENSYCYHVDSKSPKLFRDRMAQLSACLPNVHLTNVNLKIEGRVGRNVNFAHLACLKLLEQKGPWNYVILQQTHDVVIRTNDELKRIFQTLNGSNDVQITPCDPANYDQKKKWDAESLGVFTNPANRPPAAQLRQPMFIAKGAVQAALSRDAVRWINRVNLAKLIRQFNAGKNAVDEMLMSSLQIADSWNMPGRFTSECIKNGSIFSGITRMVHWRESKQECKAGFLRHLVCVLGTEDLPSISQYHHILVNKMMPTFDYGAVACVSELMFNRTYLSQDDHPLNMKYYENLPTVRFHNEFERPDFQLHCENPYEYNWDEL